jgi:glycerate-2-kinase
VLAKYPQEQTLQKVGVKLLKRIDMTVEQEIAELEKEKDEKLERARLRIIAENEDELQLMQDNLNKAMQKEEIAMTEQLEKRKAEIMAVKK